MHIHLLDSSASPDFAHPSQVFAYTIEILSAYSDKVISGEAMKSSTFKNAQYKTTFPK